MYGASQGEQDYDYRGGNASSKVWHYDHGWTVTPNAGLTARLTRRVRLNLEVYTFLGDHSYNGELWAVLYGVRVHGDRMYGDISFVIPIFPDADELLQYVPIGIPMLTFGVLW